MRAAVVVLVLAFVAFFVILGLLPALRRVAPRDIAWLAGTEIVPDDEAEVYRRYLARHRGHRLAGGLFGVAFAIVAGVRFYGSVQLIGAGSVSPAADVFFGAVTGLVLGALSAETFRLAQPRARAVASLEPREPVGLSRVVTAARVLVAAALVWGLLAAVLGSVTGGPGAGGDTGPLVVAVVGLVLAGLAEATRAAVSNRRRPADSARALHVDGRIRAFAGRSVSWLQLAAATLVATWVVALTPVSETVVLDVLHVLIVLAGLVTSIVFLRRAAPRPPRSWHPAPVVEPA